MPKRWKVLSTAKKAEIERLSSCVKTEEEVRSIAESVINSQIVFIKSEAIKEFAERLNETKFKHGSDHIIYADNIDTLVKEMIGENNGN